MLESRDEVFMWGQAFPLCVQGVVWVFSSKCTPCCQSVESKSIVLAIAGLFMNFQGNALANISVVCDQVSSLDTFLGD